MTNYLDVHDLLEITRRLNVGPVRDVGLLASAAHRPTVTLAGLEPYPTLTAKAAALLHSIVRNHPLVDGNKRLAWAAAAVFLSINAAEVAMDDDEVFDLVMRAAAGELDVPDIDALLRVDTP